MTKNKTATEELIDYIMNMTEEQMEKLLNHPVFKAVMAGQKTPEYVFSEVVNE